MEENSCAIRFMLPGKSGKALQGSSLKTGCGRGYGRVNGP
jgi:hypothetical protein